MTFAVPNKTTINKDEYRPEPYVIPFAPELVSFILSGQ